MRAGRSNLLVLLPLLIAGAAMFVTGVQWGLASRQSDAFLFASHSVWTGRQILQLAGASDDDPDRAADVSAHPLENRDRPLVVNATDEQRARIVRRYRLMSCQPDEFTTFTALSRMNPSGGDLDPRMYKYGGLWVYPIGALLRLGGAVGLVQLKPDIAYYLDRPEAFGRFYVAARLYSAAWGLVGIIAVFVIVRRVCGSLPAAGAGALCFLLMPVVVNAAHEAKPHLAGTGLMLLAVLAAARFADGGGRGAAMTAALLCGAAMGMVPSAIPVLLVLPLMFLMRGNASRAETEGNAAADLVQVPRFGARPALRTLRGAAKALLVAILVYFLTNPYVAINLVRNRALLRSHFGNSASFYHAAWTGAGLPIALLLIGEGTSFVLAAAGIAGGLALLVRALRIRHVSSEQERRRRSTGMLLAAPSLVVAFQFVLFAAGQPADYARFALPLDVFLAIEAVAAIETFIRPPAARVTCFALLLLTTGYTGMLYLNAFLHDTSGQTTRTAAAQEIEGRLRSGDRVLATRLEPAPWSMPPVDLFRWRIVLLPRTPTANVAAPAADVTVAPADLPSGDQSAAFKLLTATPISWASKPFDVQPPPSQARGGR